MCEKVWTLDALPHLGGVDHMHSLSSHDRSSC